MKSPISRSVLERSFRLPSLWEPSALLSKNKKSIGFQKLFEKEVKLANK